MKRTVLSVLFFLLLVVVLVGYVFPYFFPRIYSEKISSDIAVSTTTKIEVPHLVTPDSVRGVYMTSCVAGSKTMRDKLIRLVNTTELNSIVIDVKTFDGYISFSTENELLKRAYSKTCPVPDMRDFVSELHDKKIYVIGRIAVFQDQFMVKEKPHLAVKRLSNKDAIWGDRKNIHWIDAGAKEHWDYIIALAKEAYSLGFDELNFDYIRFPSDGDMKDIYFPFSNGQDKTAVLESFFTYLSKGMRGTGAKISADLFGETTVRTEGEGIGQVLERALPYFDYVSPMVYPSHYTYNFAGLGDPNKHPYEVVKYCMDSAVARTIATSTIVSVSGYRPIASTTPVMYVKTPFDKDKIRPWLQDNNYPVTYTPAMVRAQIQATYDAGLDSWMLWNAGNRYTKEALLAE